MMYIQLPKLVACKGTSQLPPICVSEWDKWSEQKADIGAQQTSWAVSGWELLCPYSTCIWSAHCVQYEAWVSEVTAIPKFELHFLWFDLEKYGHGQIWWHYYDRNTWFPISCQYFPKLYLSHTGVRPNGKKWAFFFWEPLVTISITRFHTHIWHCANISGNNFVVEEF